MLEWIVVSVLGVWVLGMLVWAWIIGELTVETPSLVPAGDSALYLHVALWPITLFMALGSNRAKRRLLADSDAWSTRRSEGGLL